MLVAAPAAAQESTMDISGMGRILAQTLALKIKHANRPVASVLSRPLQELLGDLEDADPMVRLLAVQGLEPYIKTNMVVRKRVISCLADPLYDIRSMAVVVLGSVVEQDDAVRRAIQDLFLKDDNDAVELSAMGLLWPRISSDGAVRAKFLKIMRTPIGGIDDLFVVDEAVISVMNAAVVAADAEIRDEVLRILAYDDSWFISSGLISSTAAAALLPLCKDARVRAALQTAAARGVGGAVDTLSDCR